MSLSPALRELRVDDAKAILALARRTQSLIFLCTTKAGSQPMLLPMAQYVKRLNAAIPLLMPKHPAIDALVEHIRIHTPTIRRLISPMSHHLVFYWPHLYWSTHHVLTHLSGMPAFNAPELASHASYISVLLH